MSWLALRSWTRRVTVSAVSEDAPWVDLRREGVARRRAKEVDMHFSGSKNDGLVGATA